MMKCVSFQTSAFHQSLAVNLNETQDQTSEALPSLKETIVEGKQASLLILMIDLLHSHFRALKKHSFELFFFTHFSQLQ